MNSADVTIVFRVSVCVVKRRNPDVVIALISGFWLLELVVVTFVTKGDAWNAWKKKSYHPFLLINGIFQLLWTRYDAWSVEPEKEE